jgi:hypothetical protein
VAFHTWLESKNTYAVRFVRLDASGQPLAEASTLTPDSEGSYPSLIWDGVGYGAAWQDRRNDGFPELYFRKLSASGAPASPELRVTASTGGKMGSLSAAPKLVWTGAEYGLAYSDTRLGTYAVFLARLSADGTSVLSDVVLSETMDHADTPTAVYAHGAVWVGWVEKVGTEWCGEFNLAPNSPAIDHGVDVGLPYSGAGIDIGACELGGRIEGAGSIAVARVGSGGSDVKRVVVAPTVGFSAFPSLELDGSALRVAWFDTVETGRDIHTARLACGP